MVQPKQACDSCKRRKERCDKGSPRSDCNSSGAVCRTTNDQSEPRSRVIDTKEYEKKIDSIVDRLGSIEALLQSQSPVRSAGRSDGLENITPGLSTPNSSGFQPAGSDINYNATAESRSAIASNVVQHAVATTTSASKNADLLEALQLLKGMVSNIKESPAVEFLKAQEKLPNEPPPTLSELEKLVSLVEGSFTLAFLPGATTATIQSRCEDLFYAKIELGPIRRIYVYGVLWNLTTEAAGRPDLGFASRCRCLAKYFAGYVEQAVKELPIIMPVTMETASALTLAVSVNFHIVSRSAQIVLINAHFGH